MDQKKYEILRLFISDNKQQIYKDNFIPLFNNMKADLTKWNKPPIYLTGRIFRMASSWLPKFLDLFSVIPITTTRTFFKKIYTTRSQQDFIQENTTDRINRTVFTSS